MRNPNMTFTAKYSSLRDSAQTTAERLPNESVAVWVRKANTHCAELHEARAEALRVLENLDRVYTETWDVVYQQAAQASA